MFCCDSQLFVLIWWLIGYHCLLTTNPGRLRDIMAVVSSLSSSSSSDSSPSLSSDTCTTASLPPNPNGNEQKQNRRAGGQNKVQCADATLCVLRYTLFVCFLESRRRLETKASDCGHVNPLNLKPTPGHDHKFLLLQNYTGHWSLVKIHLPDALQLTLDSIHISLPLPHRTCIRTVMVTSVTAVFPQDPPQWLSFTNGIMPLHKG